MQSMVRRNETPSHRQNKLKHRQERCSFCGGQRHVRGNVVPSSFKQVRFHLCWAFLLQYFAFSPLFPNSNIISKHQGVRHRILVSFR